MFDFKTEFTLDQGQESRLTVVVAPGEPLVEQMESPAIAFVRSWLLEHRPFVEQAMAHKFALYDLERRLEQENEPLIKHLREEYYRASALVSSADKSSPEAFGRLKQDADERFVAFQELKGQRADDLATQNARRYQENIHRFFTQFDQLGLPPHLRQ